MSWQTKRIALVDPSPGDKCWLEMTLCRLGMDTILEYYQTDLAALKAFCTVPAPDLLIIEELLPLFDLPDVISRVKRISGYENVPIAVLVTDLRTNILPEMDSAIYVVQKPVDRGQLALLFRQVFGESG